MNRWLPLLFRRPRRALRKPVPIALPALIADCRDDEPVLGCGWFDSSHDLRSGLKVREHTPQDAGPAELPLALWLDLHLAGSAPSHAVTTRG